MTRTKTIWFVNGYTNGSTGKIVDNLCSFFSENNFKTLKITSTGRGQSNDWIPLNSSKWVNTKYKFLTHFCGTDGFSNIDTTKSFLTKQSDQVPDIISLHNIHPYFINLPLIISFSKEWNIPIIWTLHDEWILTGRCCCFDACECERWKTGCKHCPYKNNYPKTIFNHSKQFWEEKRKLITSNRLITFISPSVWLQTLIKSPFSGYNNDCVLIHNPIDFSSFKPSKPLDNILEFAKGRQIIGLASLFWSESKGTRVIETIVKTLNPDKYFFVIAGNAKKGWLCNCANVLLLGQIKDQKKLASFYSSIDVFVNPTLQDNAPMVNLEALSCGTPVITFQTGGSAECIMENKNGVSVRKGDAAGLIQAIEKIPSRIVFSQNCIKSVASFDEKISSKKYLDLCLSVLEAKYGE